MTFFEDFLFKTWLFIFMPFGALKTLFPSCYAGGAEKSPLRFILSIPSKMHTSKGLS